MRCPVCGFENPPGMRFCGNCAQPLQAIPAGEERKLVTTLFADVVASTALAGALDPEQFHRQMTRFFETARTEIERYGGTVQKFIGDAVVAVFGLPAVHEDDPARAARAAVAIRAAVQLHVESGELPEIRIGINTGEVVANPEASQKGEFLVSGEAVSLAARLQQHANPGQILIGERTMVGIQHVSEIDQIPPLKVKGREQPLPAWELVDVAPLRPRELRPTRFVGREEDLAILRGYLRRTQPEGQGHVVTILGPAGVGKTRLVHEFEKKIKDTPVLHGRALPYGTGVPLWAVADAIREECNIFFGDPTDVARQKLEKVCIGLEIPEAVPALLSVLGLGGDGLDLSREVLFRDMRFFFQALARRSPLVLILEDIHSAEEVTLDYLEGAADWIRDAPVLLLLLSRPDLLDRRLAWMGGKRSATTLFLDPLTGEESHRLVESILGDKRAPEALLHAVLERAAGNPLFMEELVGAFIERRELIGEEDHWTLTVPVDQVAIPDTIHAVIAARIDALPAPEKTTLQDAAVQGKDLWLGALRSVAEEQGVEETVRALVGKELLIRNPHTTLAGDQEFTFRHILIRDVAYAAIPKAQRWAKHARLAEWMQNAARERPTEWADVIAHHWLQVLALRRELGLPADEHARVEAISNLLVAGDRAAGVYANTTALDHYGRLLDLDSEPSTRRRALAGRGQVWMFLGKYDRARDDFEAALSLAQETRQPLSEVISLDLLGHSFRKQDRIAEALEHLNQGLALSREIGDPNLTGRILNHIGFTYFSDLRHEEAIRSHQEAQGLLEAGDDRVALAESFHGLGENLHFLGEFERAIRRFRESLEICDQLGNRSLSAENRYMIAVAQSMLGEYSAAQAEVERSLETLQEIGDVWNLSPALWAASLIASAVGEPGKALEYAARGLSLARQIEVARFAIYNLTALGLAHRTIEDHQGARQADAEAAEVGGSVGGAPMALVRAYLALDAAALGRTADAEKEIAEARRVLSETETRVDYLQEVTHAEGRVFLSLGRSQEARNAARVLSKIASETGTVGHWRVPGLLLEADSLAAEADHARAAPIYRKSAEEAERLGRRPARWRALAGLAEAQAALGESDQASASAGTAREIIEALAARVSDERLRAGFLQSAKVQRVISLSRA